MLLQTCDFQAQVLDGLSASTGSYSGRQFLLNENKAKKCILDMSKRIETLDSALNIGDSVDTDNTMHLSRLLLSNTREELISSLRNPCVSRPGASDRKKGIRYCISDGIEFDTVYILEWLGLAMYSKKFRAIYTLQDRLDVLLSIVMQEPYAVISRNLANNCHTHGISYKILSRGILNQSNGLLKHIQLPVLLGVSDGLDALINNIYNGFDTLSFVLHGTRYRLKDKCCTPNDAVKFVIYNMLLQASSYILCQVYEKLLCESENNKNWQITSKSLSSIVINASEFLKFSPIELLVTDGIIKVDPILVSDDYDSVIC